MKNKNQKVKTIKYHSEEQKEIFKFILILAGILLVVGVLYLVSYFASTKNTYHYNETKSGEINYDVVSVGTMFNRPNDEYYVVLYDEDDTNGIYYASVMNKYSQNADALKVYYCNLGNKLNEDYYVGDKGVSNNKAKTIDDVAFGDFTFVKIKDGKIVKYIEDIENVKDELGLN